MLNIATQFSLESVENITELGNGLINDTYLVATARSQFVLQKMNDRVFLRPEQIMDNLATLAESDWGEAASLLKIPEIIKTQAQQNFVRDDSGQIWRALSFIENTISLESIRTLLDAEEAGLALGRFHRIINRIHSDRFYDTLPGFHIATEYYQKYLLTLEGASNSENSPEYRYCTDYIETHAQLTNSLEDAKNNGLLPVKIIHGDPKLNNFLFDKTTQKIVSLIDLDTVKPGLLHYDIGDCLRSLCQTRDPVGFDLVVCEAVLENYLAAMEGAFSSADYRFLYPAIRLIPFELGLRFFTDYLEGNRYFKVSGLEQNLHRAVEQFQLSENIRCLEQPIEEMINRLRVKLA